MLIIVQQKFCIYYVTHRTICTVFYIVQYTEATQYDLSSRGFRKEQNGTREKAADIQKSNFLFLRSRRIACNCTYSIWDAQNPMDLN